MEFSHLYERAFAAAKPKKLSDCAESGGVGAAIETADGNIYVGVCVDTSSSMGFCAEHAAAAAMLTAGENRIAKVIAVDWSGKILPPCGRCREFLSQLSDENMEARVMVRQGVELSLRQLLPFSWRE